MITLECYLHAVTVSGYVIVLVYSSMGPEDTGSDEEDRQDDVHGLWGRARASLLFHGP